jgi:hypothetical protein
MYFYERSHGRLRTVLSDEQPAKSRSTQTGEPLNDSIPITAPAAARAEAETQVPGDPGGPGDQTRYRTTETG